MGRVSTAAAWCTAPLRERSSSNWEEDVVWHRRMYGQSHFRWVTEDVLSIATRYTRGRLKFSTPAHLSNLDVQLLSLLGHTDQIRLAMAAPLREVRGAYGRRWGSALKLINMTELDARVITWSAIGTTPDQVTNSDAGRALRGIPLPNPLTEIWELRQMLAMHQAAVDVLEDASCDLVLELTPSRGLGPLAPLTLSRTPAQLAMRVNEQRELRGEPGDPRRIPEQTY